MQVVDVTEAECVEAHILMKIELMYCHHFCVDPFPLLHKNCAMLELLITCTSMWNGLGISCHAIINHFHNFALN